MMQLPQLGLFLKTIKIQADTHCGITAGGSLGKILRAHPRAVGTKADCLQGVGGEARQGSRCDVLDSWCYMKYSLNGLCQAGVYTELRPGTEPGDHHLSSL